MTLGNLDASEFIQGSQSEKLGFAKQLIHCLKTDGFVKIHNHGIPNTLVSEMFAWDKRFFDLPAEVKKTCLHRGGDGPVRGFNDGKYERSSKLHSSSEGTEDAKDALESFNIGPLKATEFPNQWVAEETLPNFREHVEGYYILFQKIANMILEAIELGLGIPPGSMTSLLDPDPSEVRMNHYPSISKKAISSNTTRRIWPHTDFGIITLLVQDSEGGLEFEDRTNPGTYLPVTSENQSDLIVNVSDILERWTNGVLKAGLHHVSVPAPLRSSSINDDYLLPERYSVAYFQRPGGHRSAGPMPFFVSESRPANYDEITAVEYLGRRNSLVY